MKDNVPCSVALLVLAAVGAAAPALKEADGEQVKGTWVVVVSEKGGEKQKGQVGERAVIDGDHITLHWGEKRAHMRYRLDPGKRPKRIDLENEQRETAPGIYELDGDTLRICHPKGGAVRSDKFESRKDSPNYYLLILRRAK